MWRIVRLVLVAAWLTAAVAAWWGAPREAAAERAVADVEAGRVVAYQWGDHWSDDAPDRWFSVPSLSSSTSQRSWYAWRTPDGRTHWTDTGGAPEVADRLRASGPESRSGDVTPLSTLINGIGLLFTVVFLGVILAGPAPLTGTRWYWFWLFALVPFGLGLLYWTFRDVPWTRPRQVPPPTPDGAEHRLRGFRGLIAAALVSAGVSLLLVLLTMLLGERWVPELLSP
ncbi:hypothetical protein [Actinoplanes teichomyceticus]|uniref:Uncharacterized protein n=1 Tax=Actinoplanes teichomyceticus TaxID=1867 RepID=A0A561VL43_ACTTI|nr:hypothetical protein [Actinoplanes teichomyceticus]TWG12333.1 hypothetical protein FHX34_105200 [Actinoplanes teichomyceticus]GIF14273.1 hypothetical protein Ate01nite_43050 [Actinoplanes teichomyceticus]